MRKSIIALLLCTVTIFTLLAGCTEQGGDVRPYTIVYQAEATTLNYLTSGTVNDTRVCVNVIDGLLEYDNLGNLVPSLATEWSSSPDFLTWTFKLREGVQWVDNEGKEIGEVTSEDWIAAAEHVLNPENSSGNTHVWSNIILGASEMVAGETTNMADVGIKAIDAYTLEYNLATPMSYFPSLLTTNGHFPAYAPQVRELGKNFALDNESMYFNGGYILETFLPQEQRVYVKNEKYWEAEKIHIELFVERYNSEAEVLAPDMFLRGEVDDATISTAILDEWLNDPETKDIVTPSPPDISYMYYYMFNYNPQFDEEYEPENWALAVDNEAFRLSLYWGLDRLRGKTTLDPHNPELFMTNTITPATAFIYEGEDYVNMGALAEVTARTFPDEDQAIAYRDQAIEELTAAGATFPIKILMPYSPATTNWDSEVQVVKQQLETLLGTDYIQCEIVTGTSTGFLDAHRRNGNYAFMRGNNSIAVADPRGWQRPFMPGGNWTFLDLFEGPNVVALRDEYYALVEKANAILEQPDRYLALAEAEAFLINHALVIPYSTDTYGYKVSRINEFEKQYSPLTGPSRRLKGVHLLEEPITVEQFMTSMEERNAALGN